MNQFPKYIQPNNFANYLFNQQEYSFFLDIDGTLADFTMDPKDSIIPKTTLTLLRKIQSHGIKVAIVTGRSLAEARKLVFPLQLPIAATHGLEITFDGSNVEDVNHVSITELDVIRQAIIQSSIPYSDFLVENKPYSVALHYRQNPALADLAYNLISTVSKNHANWVVKAGKCVWEILPKEADKGTAILSLLKKMQGSDKVCPIFIGDDMTDEAGFMAVQGVNESQSHCQSINGMGIKVGSEPTCAHYYVNDIYDVTVLLDSFLAFHQKYHPLSSDRAQGIRNDQSGSGEGYESPNRII